MKKLLLSIAVMAMSATMFAQVDSTKVQSDKGQSTKDTIEGFVFTTIDSVALYIHILHGVYLKDC